MVDIKVGGVELGFIIIMTDSSYSYKYFLETVNWIQAKSTYIFIVWLLPIRLYVFMDYISQAEF